MGTAESTAQALTKDEFIRQADEICAEAEDDIEPIEEELDNLGSTDYEQAADLLRQGVERADEEMEDLRALTPPNEDEEIVGETIGTVEDQLALTRRLAEALEREDDAAIESLSDEIKRGQERAEGLAQGYGFKECGSGD